MKLTRLLMSRIAIALTILLGLWALLFYLYLDKRVYRIVDTGLQHYATEQISSFLASPENFPRLKEVPGEESYSYSIIGLSPSSTANMPAAYFSTEEKPYASSKGSARIRSYHVRFTNGQGEEMLFRTWISVERQKNLLDHSMQWILCLYISLITIILLINYLVLEKNMGPLYRLLDWIERFDIQTTETELENPTLVKEFRILNKAVSEQFRRSSRMYEQQKHFVDNAAHEMQTPLAVCMNRLEQMLQKTDLSEELMQEIILIQNTLRKLSHLQRDMLRLSRIENGAYQETECVDMGALSESALDNLKEIFAHKQLACSIEKKGVWQTVSHPALAELLVNNLLRNAFVHSPEQGEIRIGIGPDGLSVSNSGDKALDADSLFRRFSGSARRSGSSGLGLSICKAICGQYGWKIEYRFENGLHSFSVKTC